MTEQQKILIVDDDREICELLVGRLQTYGFAAHAVDNGADMAAELTKGGYDLIVLDIMLRNEDGLDLCRRLRSSGAACRSVPVIFLSALNETADRIVGLEMGGDDYLPKPFETRELVARIKAILRRSEHLPENGASFGGRDSEADERGGAAQTLLVFGPWKCSSSARHLIDDTGLIVPLSAQEYRLLAFFLEHPQQVLSREQLVEHVASRTPDIYDRSLDAQISRLRSKLRDDAKNPEIIRTMRGDGYMLATLVTRERADDV